MHNARNLWEKSNAEKNKMLQPGFKKCNNRLLSGYCMGASSLTAKPGNYAQLCMPIVEKIERESEWLLFARKIGVCWNIDYSNIMDCCCQDIQE